MKHCKKHYFITNGICLDGMKECVKENCNQWQPFTNYDRLRNVSVEEMAKFIDDKCTDLSEKICFEHCEKTTGNKHACPYIRNYQSMNCFKCIKQWLESEVTE
jgi:hypothetical protein